ncbi:MAG: assimilatory sulfite reductase (NADPH) flavoprotein subunit [Bacteroidales bacterium]
MKKTVTPGHPVQINDHTSMEKKLNDILFDEKQQKLLNKLLESLTPPQGIWLGGYLTGFNMSGTEPATVPSEAAREEQVTKTVTEKLKILYGSRTGNSKGVASEAHRFATSLGITSELADMNDYNKKNLKKEKNLLIVVSTDGEGDPPLPAEELYNFLMSNKAPSLENLQYAVLALGDSSYQHYCKIGKDFDERLRNLGATPLFDRVDCDLDYQEDAQSWYEQVMEIFRDKLGADEVDSATIKATTSPLATEFSAKKPYEAVLLDKFILNGRGSEKETWHVELSIEDSGLIYEPGDSIGIITSNDEKLVDAILEKTSIRSDTKIKAGQSEKSVREALINDYEISTLTRKVLENYSRYLLHDRLDMILDDQDYLNDFLYGRDLLDLLHEFSSIISANELVSILRNKQPRLYSVASSYRANPEEVHLTICAVRYTRNGRIHNGLGSTLIADKVAVDEKVAIYVDRNESFRLPEDPSTPVIMVGPGTGVAPFRAFLQERELAENHGKSWLFFGDQHFKTDFLYQIEFQKFLKKGVLTKMDVAFSRDQEYKVYVQHRLEENGSELFYWLENGAYFYLCGDQHNMAKDVKTSLLRLIKKEGKMTNEESEQYFQELRKTRRFQEDVY